MMPTDIEYLDETWQPIAMRCDPVSPGCANCWHLRMCKRHAANPKLPKALRDARAGGPFTLMKDVLDQPLHWKKPRRIGVQFMGDWLHEKAKSEWIDAMLEVMGACPQHTFLTLTKRIGNYKEKVYDNTPANPLRELGGGDYLPNLWLGVTCENQEWADKRIPVLLQIPATVRFVSIEPMLGPVDLQKYLWVDRNADNGLDEYGQLLSWVIIGPETGPHRRPCDLEWIRSVVEQCHAAAVPVFVKSLAIGKDIIKHSRNLAFYLGYPPEQLRQWPKTK